MNYLIKDDQISLEALLNLYDAYKKEENQHVREHIADTMMFANPLVWIAYKYTAYQGTDHALNTVHDLREHSAGHDGICQKRWQFLKQSLLEKSGIDIENQNDIDPRMSLADFIRMPEIQKIRGETATMLLWQKYEYYRESNQVAKWKNYSS